MTAAATPTAPRVRRCSPSSSTRCASCLPGRRWIGALVPAAAAVLFGLLATHARRHAPSARSPAWPPIALFGLVLPVTCLVIGDAVLGAEVRSGTFAFTWMSPVPTWQIAVGRWLGGTLVAAGLPGDRVRRWPPSWPGRRRAPARSPSRPLFGAQAYVAVFIAIGCITKRAAVWSLAFVFLVERLLGAALTRHRPARPVLGGPGRLRRPHRRPRRPRPRGHPPRHRRPRPPRASSPPSPSPSPPAASAPSSSPAAPTESASVSRGRARRAALPPAPTCVEAHVANGRHGSRDGSAASVRPVLRPAPSGRRTRLRAASAAARAVS